MSEPLSVPLPVLTTHRPDRRDRGYLAWVAVANEVAHLPLDSAPIDAIPHALEIHVSGVDEPLVVIAEPMGQPTEEGFPLRLRPIDEEHEAMLRHELFGGPPPSGPPTIREEPKKFAFLTPATAFELPVKGGSTIPPPMTHEHALALERTGAPTMTLSRRAPGAFTGRTLGDGRFQLDRLLGGGASGEVYRALHTTLRRNVAVKVLHPQLQQSQDYCARFYGEALAASRLDHRNVLRVLDYGQEPDSTLYIVMELLEGKSLQDILDEAGRLPLDRIVHLVAQACAGLAHAHEAGVIHRDMKPENIVVVKRKDDEGRETELVKVCDFGIAHWTPLGSTPSHSDTAIDRPDASQIVGTPVYMAPEQIRNETVDARTDVYALGVVLYELATGRVPFESENPIEILMQHLHDAPRRPSQIDPKIDPDLEAIIMKALAKDPRQRHGSARELRTALRALVDDDANEGSGLYRRASLRGHHLTASDFLATPAEALGDLHAMDERTRGIGYAALGEALKSALVSGNLKIGRDLVAWIDARLADPGLRVEEREDAERARRALRDPAVVHAVAAHLVDAKPEQRDELLGWIAGAGPVAANALIDLRRTRMASLEMRSRFVSMLRALGPSALPAIVAALEPLVLQLTTRHEEALAEDLLRSLPDVASDAAGDVAVRFVRLDKAGLGMAALRAVSVLWGVRARPLLVGVLDANADAFRLLAIEALQRLGGMDDGALERLARILVGQSPASDEVKLAAAAAFASALPECRPRAIWFLRERLTPQQGFMSSLRKAIGPREDVRLLAALVRSYAQLDRDNARPFLERLAAAHPELRPHVDAILAGR